MVKGNEYGFRIGEYDKSKELVIDPLLASTFLSLIHDMTWLSMDADRGGNVYVYGVNSQMDIPPFPGVYDESYNGGHDVFIAKFDADLTTLLAFTYLGGANSEDSNQMSVP